MITIRRSAERGHADYGWLDTRHSFSFGRYYDPAHMGFRALRVINEDVVQPGKGFPTHPHDNMEIVTFVLEGALEHRDSTGTGSIVGAGEVQRMSAGTGVTHSEYNASDRDRLHFFQIWIEPERQGLTPGYEQRRVVDDERRGRLALIGSRDGRDGSLTIHQDVNLFSALLAPAERITHSIAPGRHAWVQVARGSLSADGQKLVSGDGAAISGQESVELLAEEPSELLLFDLA
jgi:redox-sensitive bicupin YhaK (pirin superfamily)